MTSSILGLGTALPTHTMTQREALELAQQLSCRDEHQARLARVLYLKAGVERRHTVLPHNTALDYAALDDSQAGGSARPTTGLRMKLYAEHAPPLACQAARVALGEASLAGEQITHLITVSCTGFAAPRVDVELIEQLSLPATVQRVQIGFMGCHGVINGLRVAQALSMADPAARVLLCAVELCSLHYRFQWDPDTFIGNALFADGAAAAVVGGSQSAAGEAWNLRATGSCLLPDSKDAMSWQIGDDGFEMRLLQRVPELIGRHLRPWLSMWLDRQGLGLRDIASWDIHPGGPRILDAVDQALSLPPLATDTSRRVLAECGNMSSPTVLFILDRLQRQQAPRPCVLLGFGPGLMAEAALLV